MYYVRLIFFLSLVTLWQMNGEAQKERVLLDGLFSDWQNRSYHFTDPSGDGRFGYDFRELTIENDENFLFLYFDVGLEINLQEQNDITLLIDTDNNAATGWQTKGVGADLVYYFGDRKGYFYTGSNQVNINHEDIGLFTLPSVSSDRFEIAINQNSEINNQAVFPGGSIRCILWQNANDGDQLPDGNGGVLFTFSSTVLNPIPQYSIRKVSGTDFRILSYNVLFDELFADENPFRRQITAINPDIIGFQEIYDHSAAQTEEKIKTWLGGSWYSAKQGSDIILVSRFPIIESHYVNGNGAFLLNVNNKPLLVINAHLPCCDNDSGRQDEVDAIMSFIRKAKEGNSSLQLETNTPVIIQGDMNFVGKNRQLKTLLTGDINNEFVYGTDFLPDWDNTAFADAIPFTTETPLAFTWYDTKSAYNPGRLDYIIYSDAVLKLRNAFNLFSTGLPNDTLIEYAMLKNDTENAADHIPVVADFSFGNTLASENITVPKNKLFRIFPNPSSQYFRFELLQNGVDPIFYSIINSKGEAFRSDVLVPSDPLTHLVDTSDYPPGIYYIIGHSRLETYSEKLILLQ